MMSARKPKKPTTIRPPAKKQNSEAQFEEAWEKLSTAIVEIYKRNAGNLSFEELYRNAYNMVLHKKGDKLYKGVRGVITDHLEQVAVDQVVPSFPQSAPGGGMTGATEFLKEIRNVWDDHTTCLKMIRDILRYMDTVYVKQLNLLTVYDSGIDLFRDVITRSGKHPIQTHLINSLLYHIRLERDGEVVDRLVVKSVTDMLVSLTSAKDVTRTGHEPTVYETDFEVQFLQTSNDFYSLESGMSLHECNATEYLKRAERRLIEEEQRIDNYLTPATEPKIRRVVEKQLLENHVKTIIEMENSGMVSMMEDDKLDDLRRMYKLLGRVPNGHIQMRQTLSQFMEDHVAEINQTVGGIDASQPSRMSKSASASSIPSAAAAAADTEKAGAQKADPLKWVEQVLALKEKVDAYFEHSFANDSNFETEMNNALERSLNRNRKAPEFVSLFIDENLKKGLKGKSEEEVDALLDRTVTIFRFVQEKDIFERYYKQHLAKRLLFGKSISEDVEKNMISKLKTECGYQFTQKWEGMFNDMRTSTDMMVDFHNHLATAVTAPKDMVNLNISILTSSYWPMTGIGADQVCHFPPEVAACQQHFDKYYHSRHSGRRLTWSSQLGTADIKASFKKGNKEFNVSTYGMLVLVGVFNDVADGEAVSYQTISDKSGIPEQDLKRTLQSLALGKHKILLKSTKGPAVNPTDTFKVNTEFTSPMYKFKIQQVAGSTKSSHGAAISGNSMETDAERTETMEKIEEARKHQIEACIVRIMKARKKLDHNNLVAEVIKQTTSRFVPEPAIVKRRIEGLIEREYLERDKSDRKMYNYLA